MEEHLIVALDASSMSAMEKIVLALGDSVSYYKVGMELFYATGGQAVPCLLQAGKKVFLDLKLHDIPNTVGQSMAVLTGLGVSMLNLHAGGGLTMMRRAREAVDKASAGNGAKRPLLLAVTVLTSIGQEEWQNLHMPGEIGAQVVHLAQLAQKAGMDGVVASPQEAASIRAACGREFLIVTPGIRPAGSAESDQQRIATPRGAIRAGASYLVVGRPITGAKNPTAMVQKIIGEMGD
ncbi:orotidine-5'-phosphate decarboxylase [Acetonema longum]|uniref:Orotidine 5'-phosphate decarboxylase n=1 Tax=Acetonema longum DSM 6540 TaxID=1009370 RepID=F7NDV6_9FIRM|nr:orotidine-5'-phosphate decarboxylase [Acetonema longum]EGO65771.1 orotidine 5'-phosphate decarboxylase [Acetonema longum DSM 6540]